MCAVVGRQTELGTIGDFLDSIKDGPAELTLDGEAGIGKTTLWQFGTAEAEKRGFRVLACRPGESEARLSYAAVADLLAGVGDGLIQELPDPQRSALEVALLRAKPEGRALEHRAVAAGLLSVLRRLSDEGPIVVAIDDVQWLDRSSARAIEFASRRLTGSIGVLVSRRIEIRRATGAPFGLPDPARLGRLEIGPMSLGAIHQVLKERTGEAFPRPTLVRIHGVSGGNPFFALELARVLGEGPMLSPSARFPSVVSALARRRLRGLEADVREVLLAAACLAAPTVEVLRRAINSDAASLLGRAEDLGIVEIRGDRVNFTHPLLASGLYATEPPARRRAIHRRLAAAGLDSEERARHLALAATSPEQATIAALDDAAEHARGRGAPAAAAELVDLALSLGADDPARRIHAASYHFDAGDSVRARALLEQTVGQLPPGRMRADALRLLASVRLHDDSYEDADRLLEQALAEAADDPALRVQIVLELLYVFVNLGRVNDAVLHVEPILEEAEEVGDSALIAQALAGSTIVRFLNGQGLDEPRLDRALRLEDPERQTPVMFRPSLMASLLWMWTGKLDKARDRLYALRRDRLERGEENDLMFIGFEIVMLECWRGDLASAQRVADETLDVALQIDTPVLRAMAFAGRAFVSAYAGDATAARGAAETAIRLFQAGSVTIPSLWPIATLGFLDLSEDAFEPAARQLAPMAAGAASMGVHEPVVLTFAADAAEALIAVGRTDEAEVIVDDLETAGRRLDRAWALAVGGRCRALLLAADGRLDAAIEAALSALVQHERVAMPFERARTLLVLGRLQRRHGQRRKARHALQAALSAFEAIGTELWAKKARGELQRLGLTPGGTWDLTPSERRIAELTASGLSNREVAAAILVSPKTVEASLARVYRKLDIRSRAELGRRMAEGGLAKVPADRDRTTS